MNDPGMTAPLRGPVARYVADINDAGSLAARFRQRGFDLFRRLLNDLPRPITILDVGGTPAFWETMSGTDQAEVRITLVNVLTQIATRPWMTSLVADATQLSGIGDRQYDVVFSHSLIEHVGDFPQQQRVAAEICRVGRRYFVQTPNFWFPIEPHFLCPGFHWLPLGVRAWLVSHFRLGWIERIPDRVTARRAVAGIRLLRPAELRALFPGATLYEVRLLGLAQSLIVYGGW